MLPRRFSSRRVSPRLMPDSLVNSPTAYVHRKTGTDPNSRLWNWCLSPFLHTAVSRSMPPHRFSSRRVRPRPHPDSLVNPPPQNGRQPPPCRLTDFSSRRVSTRLTPDRSEEHTSE